ncbi:MAG: monooxygenase [Candidatus Marinimicrobia bacterium]|nr:monooxygenase [Candidatus Neomarinimicrobiota bacterium]
MHTAATDLLGIDVPIFAFSHCRDVVVEVSKAGGFGCLGAGYYTKDQLKEELTWIDDHIEGKPYGIDVLMPNKHAPLGTVKIDPTSLPREQSDFLKRLLDNAGVPELPKSEYEAMIRKEIEKVNMTRSESESLFDTALEHPIKMVVNALGVPSKEQVERMQSRDIRVGALVGKPEHAIKQKEAGVDIIIAQGSEAGGHTGTISSMVLWPQIIDAVAPLPVLAAGGIGRGRQMAAAMAMGCAGIWCGSIWLGTKQSDLLPEEKECLFEGRSEDAIQSRSRTGKPARVLRSKLTEAWEQPTAPPFLPMPLQTLVTMEARLRINRGKAKEYMSPPVGQIVSSINDEGSVKQLIFDMLMEFTDCVERLNSSIEAK